jgi:choline dehydrogenase-like flavoprotein
LWGRPLVEALDGFFISNFEIEYEVFHDFIPNKSTTVTLDSDVKDKWGLPVAHLTIDESAHHKEVGRFITSKMQDVLDTLRPIDHRSMELAGINRHVAIGTCRAGKDASTSVLNEYSQAHSVPNLFVVDGSFMPTSGGVPPTLTIVANSLRTADHVIARARKG